MNEEVYGGQVPTQKEAKKWSEIPLTDPAGWTEEAVEQHLVDQHGFDHGIVALEVSHARHMAEHLRSGLVANHRHEKRR
jgi:hypothetical protein